MATFKHISSKNADYGAAEQYLTFEHDEFTMKPTLDENGRLVPREDYRLATLNCGDEDFAVACMRSNLRYGKNQKRDSFNPQAVYDDMHMNVASVIVSVRVGADNGLVSGEMFSTKLLAQFLRPVYGQAVVCPVPWVKADDIVVAFHIFPFLVFLIAEISPHTGNSEILAPAVEGRNAVILPRYQPPVFIKGGLHGKLVMLKCEVGFRCAIVRIFRADMFECCQQRHLPFARLQTSRRQGRKWRLALQRTAYCRAFRIR